MLTDLFNLHNKVALVSGASRGLGQAMAVGLAEAGADIIALSTNKNNLRQTETLVKNCGQKILSFTCDITNYTRVDDVINKTESQFGHIDILVNNAGITHRAPASGFSDSDWQVVINSNVNAAFHMCREVAKIMIKHKSGKIINMASLLSFKGGIEVPAYAASKGAVMQLTKALANEWAEFNIQVNAIAPGYFITDLTRPLLEEDKRNGRITESIPAGYWGEPQDIKGTVVYLASSASDYVTGHILVIDGGCMAR